MIRILGALLPEGIDGGVSTAPLSYKPWLAVADDRSWEPMIRHLVQVAEALIRLREETGALVHLDIEPEPDCTIENTVETLDFFERHLLSSGAALLARSLGLWHDRGRELLLEHIRLCFDCCHFAVEFEHPRDAMDRIRAAGIKIGRIQLSSALDVAVPGDPASARDVRDRLRAFADTTYLHQVVEHRPTGLRHYLDLPDALDAPADGEAQNWRIHFHVPLFASHYGVLGSTQSYVADVLRARARYPRDPPPRDRDLHLGRAARGPESGPPRIDRPRVRLGAADLQNDAASGTERGNGAPRVERARVRGKRGAAAIFPRRNEDRRSECRRTHCRADSARGAAAGRSGRRPAPSQPSIPRFPP